MLNWFAENMRVSIIFAGLGCLAILCIVVIVRHLRKNKKAEETAVESVLDSAPAVDENRQEILAAVCAAVSEELGADVSAIRVLSFKKL